MFNNTSQVPSVSTPPPPPPPDLLYTSVLGCLGTLGILLNALLIFAIWRNKRKEFRNATSCIIANLALADSLTGLAVLLYVAKIQDIQPYQLGMIWTTIQSSLLSLMVLSVERTIAFMLPFKSSSIVTVHRTLVVLVCTWSLSVCCGVSVLFYKVPSQFAMTVIFESSILVFITTHGLIFVKMHQRNKEMRLLNKSISKNTVKAMHQSANNHVTTAVLILIFILVVTVLPYMVALQIILWDKLKLSPGIDKQVLKGVITFAKYFYPIELLNFMMNPIVYAWRLKRYRKAFIVALDCCGLRFKNSFYNGSSIYNRESFVRYQGKATEAVLLSKLQRNGSER